MGLNEAQKKERSEFLEKNLEITECSQRKPYVFISYASDNWKRVFQSAVVPMQKQYGLRVYADKAFDKVNDRWIVPMLRNVRGADVVVAFISQSYIESYACFLELLTAVNNRKQVVFVSLEDQLHLGDTTDQPVVERGVKNEILNQGANISTNTNNTSNDTMRAMKSAFTSLSTLLEQDALSKYDISDAFINFFRDAAINRKTINDLGAVRGTIRSVSRDVFDQSLVSDPVHKPGRKVAAGITEEQGQPVSEVSGAAGIQTASQAEPEPVPASTGYPESGHRASGNSAAGNTEPGPRRETQQRVDFSFSDNETEKKAKRSHKAVLIGIGATVAVLLVLILALGGGTKRVTDRAYTTSGGISGTYTGEWKKDQPEGQGVLTDENGDIYEGEWVDGLPNGQGTMTGADGTVYEGEWKDGSPNGHGINTTADGVVCEGEWKDGQFSGTGTMTWPNGDAYEGEWKDGQPDGHAVYTYANGYVYEGEWKDGVRNGPGAYTYADGSVYEVQYENDVLSGECVYTKADGTVEKETWVNGQKMEILELDDGIYTGSAKDGKPEGTGTMTYTDGGVYEGEWENGKRSGKGTMKYSDGGTYEGEWKEDEFNGHGVRKFPDGGVYDGEYVDSKRHGDGVYTEADGTVWNGKWDHGTWVG